MSNKYNSKGILKMRSLDYDKNFKKIPKIRNHDLWNSVYFTIVAKSALLIFCLQTVGHGPKHFNFDADLNIGDGIVTFNGSRYV